MTINGSETKLLDGLYGFEYVESDRRRVPTEDRGNFNIKSLWYKNREIVNLAARGYNHTEIAGILNVTPATVSNTLNSDLGRRLLSELRLERDTDTKALNEKVRVLTHRALQVYDEIFEDESGQVTMKDKKDVADTVILELSGLRQATKVQSHSIHTVLTPEEIADFKKRGIEAGKECGITIDVEPEETQS